MAKPPIVTGIEVHEHWFEMKNMKPSRQGPPQYSPGDVAHIPSIAMKVHTDAGITGEYVNSRVVDAAAIRTLAAYVIGENALERERLYVEMKRAGQQIGRLGMGLIDIALWDIAGKYHGAPIFELLGGHRQRRLCAGPRGPGTGRRV